MSTNGNGGNYAPLKQMLSDSESEEDQKLENALNIKATDSCNNLEYNSGLQSSKNYSMSDMDEFNTNVNTMESTMDNVSFLQSDMSYKMSFPRRCAFITSILMCVFTVVIFLWGIPCSEAGSCASAEWQDKTTSWELPYDEIELSGAVQVVEGALPNTKNLIFIYRGNHMKQDDKNMNDNVNGVILIVGNSGKVGWYTRETRIPTEINCHIIDVNRDNKNDCIVSGTDGFLAALNPLSGTYYWNFHKPKKFFSNVIAIDFPIVIKDLDKDKVNDLLTVATVSPSTNHNTLVIISGATGGIIGEPTIIDVCLTAKLFLEANTIGYVCKNSRTEAIRHIKYEELNKKLMKSDQTVNQVHPATSNSKRVNLSMKKIVGNTREVHSRGPGKLIIENSGECPKSCKVNITLLLDRNGTTNVSWQYIASHVYAMRPSSFAFANSINGFVIKLCQWNSAHIPKGPLKFEEVRYNVQNQSPKYPYDIFYRPSLNITSILSFMKNTNFSAHDISERIVLLSFDNMQTHHVNVSQTDIVQICVHGGNADGKVPFPFCQPDLNYQEQSLMIDDLDGDNSHELISYYSTFVAPETYSSKNTNIYESWKLTSIVRVIRLESELPKLFVEDI